MVYEEIAAAPELVHAVSYWRFALPHSHEAASLLHTIPPDGTVSLVWLPRGQSMLLGPRVSALRVPVASGSEYVGVRFLPGAAGPLLHCHVPSLRDQLVPHQDPEFAATMQRSGLSGLDALLHTWVRRANWQGPDRVVAELTKRIVESDGTAPVSELLDGLGLSYRQILRRFHDAAGLTPKEFARVRRLRAACLQAVQSAEPEWAGLSAEAGFSDQAHLSREFQDIYAWPPRLVHEYLRRIAHVRVFR